MTAEPGTSLGTSPGNPAGSQPGSQPGRGEPWPGRLPPPSPAVVLARPLPATVTDATGDPVSVSARVLLSSPPARVSVAGGPWAEVAGWAGPWPADGQWWSPDNRRRARVQLVTTSGAAQLLASRARRLVAGGGLRLMVPLCRASLPLQLQLLGRCLTPRAAGRRSGTSRTRSLGTHRPRRALRGGAFRRGSTGRRPAGRVRRGAHPSGTGIGTAGRGPDHTDKQCESERTGVPDPHGEHLEVIARDPEGYARLSRAIAEAHLAGKEKGRPVIDLEDLAGAMVDTGWC